MNITLGSEQEQFIQEQLAQGQFQSANEVVTTALQLLERQHRDYQVWLEDVQVKFDEAAEELERGEGIALDTVVSELQGKAREAQG